MAYQINIANREINPKVINFFTFENQVTTLEFTLDNYIYDEVDLRNYKAYAVTSIKGSVDLTELEMVYDDVDDKLILTWNVGDYTLTQEGAIVYQITFKQNENDGEDSAVWYSYKAIMINRGSVDADHKIVAEYPTIMKQWLDKMDDVYATVTEAQDEIIKYATEFTNSIFYIDYDKTIPVEDRLDGRLYYQWTDGEKTKGRFEDPDGLPLIPEAQGGSSLPMFSPIWSDHLYNDASYLRADTFSWHDSRIYVGAYKTLLKEYNNKNCVEETVSGITYKRTPSGFKIADASQEDAIANLYEITGVAWYYILDTENARFKLPRTKWGFVGNRDGAGGYVAESLPNIIGEFRIDPLKDNSIGVYGTSGAFTTKTYSGTTSTYSSPQSNQSTTGADFNASRSSSTYQDNAPVQQRATQMYLYFFIGSYEREEGEINIGILTEMANGTDLEVIVNEINEVKEQAIAEIEARQIPLNVISETSGVVTLSTNKIYTMEINADTEFTLPTEVNTNYFNQIKVMAKIVGTPVITWGTSYFVNKEAPELEEGVYDLYFDYDNHLAGWVVGAISKGA